MSLFDYVTQLVPQFTDQQIQETVAQYTHIPGVDTVTDQAIAIMGECTFLFHVKGS